MFAVAVTSWHFSPQDEARELEEVLFVYLCRSKSAHYLAFFLLSVLGAVFGNRFCYRLLSFF